MIIEHLFIAPLLAAVGLAIPLALFDGPYEAAIVAGLVVILVKMGDILVERIGGKKMNGNGTPVMPCNIHAGQVTQALDELKSSAKVLHEASQALHGVVGKLEVLTGFFARRSED